MTHMNYSDDGDRHYERRKTEDLNEPSRLLIANQRDSNMQQVDHEMSASVTAAISEHRVRHQERPDDDVGAIYEMPDEDEHASSPPRSLSNQDIKSEHIPSRLNVHRFGKKNLPQAQSVFPEELSDGISKEVHESVAPRMQAHLPPEA